MPNIPDLSGDQWDELVERLVLHADDKLARLYWRGLPMCRGGAPPGGIQAADLAAEAIQGFLSETREWNRARYPRLFDFLKAIVDSKVNHLADSLENRSTRRLGEAPFGDGTSEPNATVRSVADPSTVVADQEAAIVFRQAVIAELEGDALAVRLLERLEAGIDKPADIARELNVEVAEVNNAQKRLRRKVSGVMERLRGGE